MEGYCLKNTEKFQPSPMAGRRRAQQLPGARWVRQRRDKKLPRSFACGTDTVKPGLSLLIITRRPRSLEVSGFALGLLRAGPFTLTCALGQAGIHPHKKEGDKATPAGRFALLHGFFRTDRSVRQVLSLPMRPIRPQDGWCDDPQNPNYNRLVRLPFRASHEKLWRADSLYDLVIVLDYNVSPRRKNRGSAIFLHCAREGFAPTEGCIALRAGDLRKLLPCLAKKAVLVIK